MKKQAFIYYLLTLVVLTACNNNTPEETTAIRTPAERLSQWVALEKKHIPLVQNGDVITRGGNDYISAGLRNFNDSDKAYSHAGIAFKENDTVFVYHIYVGDENPTGVMLREPIDSFCYPSKLKGCGIFRYQLQGNELLQFQQTLKYFYAKKMVFDKQFNLSNDSTMYCAELISKSLAIATNNRLIIPTTTRKNVVMKDGIFGGQTAAKLTYIAPDNLYINPFTKTVARFDYK